MMAAPAAMESGPVDGDFVGDFGDSPLELGGEIDMAAAEREAVVQDTLDEPVTTTIARDLKNVLTCVAVVGAASQFGFFLADDVPAVLEYSAAAATAACCGNPSLYCCDLCNDGPPPPRPLPAATPLPCLRCTNYQEMHHSICPHQWTPTNHLR